MSPKPVNLVIPVDLSEADVYLRSKNELLSLLNFPSFTSFSYFFFLLPFFFLFFLFFFLFFSFFSSSSFSKDRQPSLSLFPKVILNIFPSPVFCYSMYSQRQKLHFSPFPPIAFSNLSIFHSIVASGVPASFTLQKYAVNVVALALFMLSRWL
ncbi:unnamed protein product [Acanthosepion pharaonis]|uniref:Uncharacterized protein n=1 Tax=Acanthosepion pharaonis TaxID=158019 RepID=A0A812DK47_ACAPH|nr:unnamed protein product [Sepia pharaonis]